MQEVRSLDQQRDEFAQRRLIATPIAGMVAWIIVGVCSLFPGPFAISVLENRWRGLSQNV